MSQAIEVDGLSKRFRIQRGRTHNKNRTFREALGGLAKAPFRRWMGDEPAASTSDFWALSDVGFSVAEGEVVGIVGGNGAGKSTLLKVLARITKPTCGQVRVRGRVGSLLEVGAGFHPELSGRENVLFNGAVLGMSRQEIKRKFDEIVEFSEVEQFIDTPVKRYSSGMYVRLAFAVAAHLDPEILLVDEVLAVGDTAFQKKCLGAMGDVAKSGRTILFVSHNMAAVQNLCDRALVLSRGKAVYYGETTPAIREYLKGVQRNSGASHDLSDHPARRSKRSPLLRSARFLDKTGALHDRFLSGESFVVELGLDATPELLEPRVSLGIDDWMGTRLFTVGSYLSSDTLSPMRGPCVVRCHIPELPLVPGRYSLSIAVGTPHEPELDALEQAISFEVEAADFFGNGQLPPASHGRMLVRSNWESAC